MITSNGDRASASFQEIGHPMIDANNTIIINASGAAFFDSKATGKLAFLSNSVAHLQRYNIQQWN
jgi:anti-anti-sigma regulatory factor